MTNIEAVNRKLSLLSTHRDFMKWGKQQIRENVENYNAAREKAGLPRLSEEAAIEKILLYMPEGFQLNGNNGRAARLTYSDPEAPEKSHVNTAGVFCMCALYKMFDGGVYAPANAGLVLHFIKGILSYVPPEQWYTEDYESDP